MTVLFLFLRSGLTSRAVLAFRVSEALDADASFAYMAMQVRASSWS
jgi:hypothetical protein